MPQFSHDEPPVFKLLIIKKQHWRLDLWSQCSARE